MVTAGRRKRICCHQIAIIVDARLGLTLRHHGVDEFATTNIKDFAGFGFTRVWNPLTT
jgi:hypothetical protein